MPTLVSRALDDHDRQADVLGDPQAGPHAAERLHLEHRDVGGLEVPHAVGVLGPPDRLVGGDRDVDAAPHDGEVLDRRRPAARRTPARRRPGPAAGSGATASSTDQQPVDVDADPAVRARGRRGPPRAGPARRRGSGRARPTLTLAVRQPLLARTIAAAPARRPTAGTVTLTGTASRSGSGQPSSAASRAARSQGAATCGVVLQERAELAPARRRRAAASPPAR